MEQLSSTTGTGTGGGGGGTTRTSPFFSLLRLTSQSNLQEILSGSFLDNASQSNEINEILTHSILSNNFASHMPFAAPINKGVLGEATFLESHTRSVKGVDFSPNDDHIFCSAGLDGKCNIYDARFGKIKSSSTVSYQGTVNFSGLKFISTGNKIALTTSSNKLLIFDIEKGAVIQSIDRCCFSGPSRTPIAVDPTNPYSLMVPNITGKGISQIDIRSSSIIKNFDQIHQNIINDIEILDPSWSRFFGGSGTLFITASLDSFSHILDSQKNIIKTFELRSHLYSIAHTPEPPSLSSSSIALGGDRLNIFSVDGATEQLSSMLPHSKSIVRLKYTKNGTKLFLSSNDGNLRIVTFLTFFLVLYFVGKIHFEYYWLDVIGVASAFLFVEGISIFMIVYKTVYKESVSRRIYLCLVRVYYSCFPDIFVTVGVLTYMFVLVPVYTRLTSTLLQLGWRLVVHPLYWSIIVIVARQFLTGDITHSNLMINSNIVLHTYFHSFTVGRIFSYSFDNNLTFISILIFSLEDCFLRCISWKRDEVILSLLIGKEKAKLRVFNPQSMQLRATANHISGALEFSGLIIAPMLLWMFKKNSPAFHLFGAQEDVVLGLRVAQVGFSIVLDFILEYICVFVELRYYQLPLFSTWTWLKKNKVFLAWIIYGSTTMGLFLMIWSCAISPRAGLTSLM
eukprot:gene4928-6144_t